jgi:hypothetical protein
MGFADETDRSAILAAVKEIKAELPSGGMTHLALRTLICVRAGSLIVSTHRDISTAAVLLQ